MEKQHDENNENNTIKGRKKHRDRENNTAKGRETPQKQGEQHHKMRT